MVQTTTQSLISQLETISKKEKVSDNDLKHLKSLFNLVKNWNVSSSANACKQTIPQITELVKEISKLNKKVVSYWNERALQERDYSKLEVKRKPSSEGGK